MIDRDSVAQEENALGLARDGLPLAKWLLEQADTWRNTAIQAWVEADEGYSGMADDIGEFTDALSNAIGRLQNAIERLENGG